MSGDKLVFLEGLNGFVANNSNKRVSNDSYLIQRKKVEQRLATCDETEVSAEVLDAMWRAAPQSVCAAFGCPVLGR
jgi:hypothetical protein